MERVDVVVVGARLAGCAVAAPLARAGRRVLVLDRMRFPSDQLSTHVLMPAGTSELARLGALPRILALNPSRVRWVHVEAEGIACRERVRPASDGIDYGVCVPRDLQDVQLVESAREQGADVRERCTVEGLRWRAGRVAGVRYRDADGSEHEVSSTLLIGADGRRSTVAALVGAWKPYRLSRNGRGLVFRYLDDPLAGGVDAETYYQWRERRSLAFAFPTTPAGRLLILLMGHRDEAGEARRDPEGYWLRKLAEHPGLAARVAGAPPGSKLRSTGNAPAFFRASSGPGWALAGDAGHFKDPVTGQGMRDAMFAGRTLAEEILARTERPSPALCELVREAGRTTAPDLSDLFGRARTPQQIAPLGRLARAFLTALWRGERPRSETVARGVSELRTELDIRLELRADRFRSRRLLTGSEHPGTQWPAPPATSGPPAREADRTAGSAGTVAAVSEEVSA
jgi:menaquinone-9 beta-reductase